MKGTRRLLSCGVAVAIGALTPLPRLAQADEPVMERPPRKPRALQWGLGIGGYGALTGPSKNGPAAIAELFPGGRFGRFGGRVIYQGLDGTSGAAVMAGLSYVGAAALPRLQLTLHGDAGAYVFEDRTRPVFGAGIQTLLWLWGPVAIGLDSTGYLFYDGIDSRLSLGSTITLRVQR
jgi:hypothetical protein